MGKFSMTKVQAVANFKETHADFMKKNKKDKIAIKTAWNDYTDSLMKNGDISENQNSNWSQPF